MGRRTAATGLVVAGACVAIAGIALIYPPAAVILAGLAIAAAGLLGIEVRR
jgi:hypothetical protein